MALEDRLVKVHRDYRPTKDVFQLPDVAGPAVSPKLIHDPRRHIGNRPTVLAVNAIQQLFDEKRDIFPVGPQRWDFDRYNVQPIVQIFPENGRRERPETSQDL